MAATGAVGDDQRVGRRPCAPRAAGSLRPSSSRFRSARLRSRSCPPCRSRTIRRSRPSAPVPGAGRARPRPWRRRPSGGSGRAAAPRRRSASDSASGGRPRLRSRGIPRTGRRSSPAPRLPGSSTPYSSRSVNRQDGSSPITGMPRASQGASASRTRFASARASSTRPADRKVRPQHSGRPPSLRLRDVHAVARRLQHADRGAQVLGLEVAIEGIDEQHDFAPAAFRPRPVDEMVAPPGGSGRLAGEAGEAG